MATPTRKSATELELEPDAWSRFERAIDVVAKSPPQHRKAKAKRAKSPGKRKPVKKSGNLQSKMK